MLRPLYPSGRSHGDGTHWFVECRFQTLSLAIFPFTSWHSTVAMLVFALDELNICYRRSDVEMLFAALVASALVNHSQPPLKHTLLYALFDSTIMY